MLDYIDVTLDRIASNMELLRSDATAREALAEGAARLAVVLRDGGTVFSVGNGGSLCDAMHFAEELTGNFRAPRAALPATAIADPAHITCVANDFGFERVFERYVEAHVHGADALLAISTSGSSANVIRAAELATERGAFVLALTGNPGSRLGAVADVDVCTPFGPHSDRIQEAHIIVVHLLVDLVEQHVFGASRATDDGEG